jgi:hypothetical protein
MQSCRLPVCCAASSASAAVDRWTSSQQGVVGWVCGIICPLCAKVGQTEGAVVASLPVAQYWPSSGWYPGSGAVKVWLMMTHPVYGDRVVLCLPKLHALCSSLCALLSDLLAFVRECLQPRACVAGLSCAGVCVLYVVATHAANRDMLVHCRLAYDGAFSLIAITVTKAILPCRTHSTGQRMVCTRSRAKDVTSPLVASLPQTGYVHAPRLPERQQSHGHQCQVCLIVDICVAPNRGQLLTAATGGGTALLA